MDGSISKRYLPGVQCTTVYRAIVSAVLVVMCVITSIAARPYDRITFHRIPAFARKYRTSCTTCHTAAPKLNVLGEAFRLNGYQFPENDALLRNDDPVPLGADEWKELWPRAIWPGEIPGSAALALRVQSDVQVTRRAGQPTVSLRFPQEVYLLAGSTLGEDIGAFVEVEWTQEGGVEVLQAKFKFQNLLPWLPKRSLNAWVGLQNLYLFTFADRQIDRAGRQKFLWQQFRPSDLELRNPATNETLQSANTFRLPQTQAAVELNGLLTSRVFFGFGLAQGTRNTVDDNNRKDLYYKIRYKLGGLGLDGHYPDGGQPVLGGGGQLFDRTLIVEHFGYFGAQPVEGNRQDEHRSFGVNARGLVGPLDIGVGYVWGSNDNPWGAAAAAGMRYSSVFGKAEYLLFPWFMASFKFDTFGVDVPAARAIGFTEGTLDQTRVLPGVIILIRQNIRGVIEGEFYTEHAGSRVRGERRPHNLWFRLDVAF